MVVLIDTNVLKRSWLSDIYEFLQVRGQAMKMW